MKTKLLPSLLFCFLPWSGFAAVELIPASQPTVAPGRPARAAIDAYREGRRSTAVQLARPLAESGDPDALFLMGFTLESLREPARKSRGQAMDYYYRQAEAKGSAEAGLRRQLILLAGNKDEQAQGQAKLEDLTKGGDARASRILGEAWLRGMPSGKPDPAKAAELWKTAAEAGDTRSLVLLGQLYRGTFGHPDLKDPKAAAAYLRKAAELDDKESFLPLASLLLEEESLRDEKEAEHWISKAAEAGDRSAWWIMGNHLADQKKDDPAAMEHFRKGAEAGHPACMLRMAHLSMKGGTEEAEWLRKAADAGDPDAAAELAQRLKDGDPAVALRYLLVAASENHPVAQYELGIAYLEGKGCVRDPLAAIGWLTEAMKSGDAESQYKLGTLHEEGIGGPVNYANAGVLYTMACGKGHAGATARIARMAAEGLGTLRNPAQAWAHAVLAAERGDHSTDDLRAELEDKMTATEKAEGEKTLTDLRAKSPKPAVKDVKQ